MPTYPVKHTETGETKTLHMTVKDYCTWKDENPEWDKDWSEGCAGIGEVGDWRNKMSKTHPGWSEHMNKMAKMPHSQVQW